MASEEKLQEATKRLFAQLALPRNEVDILFRKAIDDSYWRALAPAMGVMDAQRANCSEEESLSLHEEDWASRHLAKHGYFRLPAFTSHFTIARMRACVEALRSAGWPPIFSYVYDEFWAVLRTPSMVRFLSRQLGENYLQTAGIWTYRVDPLSRASGWPPHVDSRHTEERLTIWIPLVDATIGNGCMYVIPQDCVPETLPVNYLDWTSVSREQFEILLHHATPLPAAAGSVLGWNHRVIHWGGQATDASAFPRLSIAVEFITANARPTPAEVPTVDANLPSIALRLRVIGQAIHAYERFEPSMRKYRELATMLIDWSN